MGRDWKELGSISGVQATLTDLPKKKLLLMFSFSLEVIVRATKRSRLVSTLNEEQDWFERALKKICLLWAYQLFTLENIFD